MSETLNLSFYVPVRLVDNSRYQNVKDQFGQDHRNSCPWLLLATLIHCPTNRIDREFTMPIQLATEIRDISHGVQEVGLCFLQ